MDNNKEMQLLEAKIRHIVKKIITEADNTKRGSDNVEKSKEYAKKYKAIQKALGNKTVNATQVMSTALGFKADDDTKRSHAFKQLHQEKTQDGTGVYKFSDEEINKIAGVLGV
jgi:predicted oxidoreductase